VRSERKEDELDGGRSATFRLPVFIIGGAMKSGTSTLHHILAAHPGVFMPPMEIHFFSLDDLNGETTGADGDLGFDFDRDFDKCLAWYADLFANAHSEQMLGERSSVYLASPTAPKRIAQVTPGVKLIFLLRDPVERAYSHYWHLVRKGYARFDFERTVQDAPDTVLRRSLYKPQLEAYLKYFPRENVKVVLFERLAGEMRITLDDLCGFLGLPTSVDLSGVDTHRNRGQSPRVLALRLLQNRILPCLPRTRPLPPVPSLARPKLRAVAEVVDKALRWANTSERKYPDMRQETRKYLERLLSRENAGLDDLIRIDLRKYWPYF